MNVYDQDELEARESLAYIAGILDGEGCIVIGVTKLGHSSAKVVIVNTFEEVIDYVDMHLPGTRWTKKNPSSRITYGITWYGQNAVDVLELLTPYLIIKRKQAEILIDFHRVCVSSRVRVGYGAITDAEKVLRNSYKVRISKLNRPTVK